MKRIVSAILALTMMCGVLAGCGDKEVEETPTVPAEPTPTVYVYGVAGDIFREFVNLVSNADMDSVRDYIDMDKENNIISDDELLKYFMSLEIGNLIYIPYMTRDISVDSSGETRNVTFKYILEDETTGSFKMKVRLVGTDWKIVVDDLVCTGAKIRLPAGNYTSIEIDGVPIDISKYKTDDDGYYIYALPQVVKETKKTVVVKMADGRYCEVEKKFNYSESNSGKVIDDGIETIELSDFYAATAQTVETEPQEPIETENVEGEVTQ